MGWSAAAIELEEPEGGDRPAVDNFGAAQSVVASAAAIHKAQLAASCVAASVDKAVVASSVPGLAPTAAFALCSA